ncbi:hypothetical protein D7193_01700 [Micromonospora costi]|uniref:Uncharacterized protein n=1 Tax=Micromonospora costi TaxID=1530042 RepID=A0A3B0ACM2_9ACTN|nr:hypothetical protein D7193_01700 [Micromonospora costi]
MTSGPHRAIVVDGPGHRATGDVAAVEAVASGVVAPTGSGALAAREPGAPKAAGPAARASRAPPVV